MMLYQEAQRKAQQEIDRVCQGRLPEFTDYDALPYVRAILKEILRWNPAVPLSRWNMSILSLMELILAP